MEINDERGISLAHTTILRWVQRYIPVFEKRWRQTHRWTNGRYVYQGQRKVGILIPGAPTTTESLQYACRLPMKDFENAMQVAAAVAGKADLIATRNIRDYAKSSIRALLPKQVLQAVKDL